MSHCSFIEVRNLCVAAGKNDNLIVNDVSFTAEKGEVIALIGESGSGKSTIALSLMGYAREGCRIASGSIRIGERDVLALSKPELRDLRGKSVAYVAQSAAAAFNPGKRIIAQIVEAASLHGTMTKDAAADKARSLFRELALPDPDTIGERYVHQVSGGQLQRMMAAMAMINTPDVIIFDEPTTALDVTTQVEVLRAFKALVREKGVTAIYVSHDIGVVAQMADHIIVLRDGVMMEKATTDDLLERPKHEFTRRLIGASVSKRLELPETPQDAGLAFECRSLVAGYGEILSDGMPAFPVLRDITFKIPKGKTLGLIGESGSGKSTIGRVMAGLLHAAKGEAFLNGRPLHLNVPKKRTLQDRKEMQIVFQMADTALNPSQTNGDILGRPLTFYHGLRGKARERRIIELLDMVRLPASMAYRKPRELSGGQKQRINLARALAAEPSLVICDEVTSALDTVVATAVIELLVELQRELGLSYLFISHDLGKVEAMCNEVMVLHQGSQVELADRDTLISAPTQDYTRELIQSVPQMRKGWLETVPVNGRRSFGQRH